MSIGLFLDPYQVCEREWGLFRELSAFALRECNYGVWKQTLLTGNWCSLQQQHTWTFMVCIPLPLTTLYSLKALLKLLSLGYCSQIKNWHGTDTLRLTPTGRKHEGGPEPCARQGLVQGICSQVPGCIRTCCGTVPVSWGDQGNGAANTAFLFLTKSLSSLSLTFLSEVSLHSDSKFRQICHWL